MAILNPEHLLDQALRLVVPPPNGPPRQVDINRAISAAYYSVFHGVLIAAADEFIGLTKRTTYRYTLVYRSVGHRQLRDFCVDATKPSLPAKYKPYGPPIGFSVDVQLFGAAVAYLQERRHAADYDPSIRFRTADALLAVRTARTAHERFAQIGSDERQMFLTLLLFFRAR